MKTKQILALLVLLTLSAGLFAQTPSNGQRNKKTPEERAQMQTDHMAKRLNLTEAQKAKVYDINFKYDKKAAEKRRKTIDEKKAVQLEKRAEMQKVLTAEQMKIYENMQTKNHSKMTMDNRKRSNRDWNQKAPDPKVNTK